MPQHHAARITPSLISKICFFKYAAKIGSSQSPISSECSSLAMVFTPGIYQCTSPIDTPSSSNCCLTINNAYKNNIRNTYDTQSQTINMRNTKKVYQNCNAKSFGKNIKVRNTEHTHQKQKHNTSIHVYRIRAHVAQHKNNTSYETHYKYNIYIFIYI